jgi:hypothetical protein
VLAFRFGLLRLYTPTTLDVVTTAQVGNVTTQPWSDGAATRGWLESQRVISRVLATRCASSLLSGGLRAGPPRWVGRKGFPIDHVAAVEGVEVAFLGADDPALPQGIARRCLREQ